MRSFLGGVALILLLGARAEAVEWGARVEPSAAFPVAAPQTRLFGLGGSVALKGGIAPVRFLDVFLSAQLVGLTAAGSNPNRDPGLAWALGAGARFRRPHGQQGLLYPWLDGDLSYVRTGALDRFGFSLAAGLAIAAGERRQFWVGPFLRYFQVVSPERAGFDTSDALVLLAGVSVEMSPPARRAAPDRESLPPPSLVQGDGK